SWRASSRLGECLWPSHPRPRRSTRSGAKDSGSASAWAMAPPTSPATAATAAPARAVSRRLKLGGTPSRNLLIGGAINGWSHSGGGATETIGNVTASLFYYPVAASGLFLSGGLGFSSYNVDTSPSITGTGWGFTAGVGYDVRVGRNVS